MIRHAIANMKIDNGKVSGALPLDRTNPKTAGANAKAARA